MISPSERMASGLGNFFLLRRLDGRRLGHTIWNLTPILYGLAALLQGYRTAFALRPINDLSLAAFVWVQTSLFQLATMLLWLLIIRLVLEVCFRMFEWLERLDRGAKAPVYDGDPQSNRSSETM